MNAYFFIDSLKDKLSIEKKETAREYFDILKENELFTPSDVIFMQFLLRESNCEELNEKCIAYATTQKALCFYEERPSKINFISIHYDLITLLQLSSKEKLSLLSKYQYLYVYKLLNHRSHKSSNGESVR